MNDLRDKIRERLFKGQPLWKWWLGVQHGLYRDSRQHRLAEQILFLLYDLPKILVIFSTEGEQGVRQNFIVFKTLGQEEKLAIALDGILPDDGMLIFEPTPNGWRVAFLLEKTLETGTIPPGILLSTRSQDAPIPHKTAITFFQDTVFPICDYDHANQFINFFDSNTDLFTFLTVFCTQLWNREQGKA